MAPPPWPIDARALAFPTASDHEGPVRERLRRYATSKLANVMTTYELARRLGEEIDLQHATADAGLQVRLQHHRLFVATNEIAFRRLT